MDNELYTDPSVLCQANIQGHDSPLMHRLVEKAKYAIDIGIKKTM